MTGLALIKGFLYTGQKISLRIMKMFKGEDGIMQNVNVHAIPNGRVSSMTQEVNTQSAPVSEIYKHLNFKVHPEFHREFKTFAASHDISMTALLIEAFHSLRESH